MKGHKTTNELATEFEVHPTQINTWKKQLLEGSKHLFSGKNKKDLESVTEERDRLYTRIGQLPVELDWLKKKDWPFKLSVKEKKRMIDSAHPEISIARQCELIQLSRASYYRTEDLGLVIETPENLELMRLIDEEYLRL